MHKDEAKEKTDENVKRYKLLVNECTDKVLERIFVYINKKIDERKYSLNLSVRNIIHEDLRRTMCDSVYTSDVNEAVKFKLTDTYKYSLKEDADKYITISWE